MKKSLIMCKTKSLDSKLVGWGNREGRRSRAQWEFLRLTPLYLHFCFSDIIIPWDTRPSLRITEMKIFLKVMFCLDRSCVQQWRNMEANLAFVPHGFAEYGDGKEDYWRQNSRRSLVSGGSTKKHQRCVGLCVISRNSLSRLNARP